MDQIAHARQFQGWFIRGIVRGKAQLASTNAGFAALPPADQEHLWREFRAYVRQAEGFYR